MNQTITLLLRNESIVSPNKLIILFKGKYVNISQNKDSGIKVNIEMIAICVIHDEQNLPLDNIMIFSNLRFHMFPFNPT